MPQAENLNGIERELLFEMREAFASGREASFRGMPKELEPFLQKYAKAALYPEKPLIDFLPKEAVEAEGWHPRELDESFLRAAEMVAGSGRTVRLITCGGVDDGKSTLIGRLLYETRTEEQQESIRNQKEYLRSDGTVDFAMLAGITEEETKQGITVGVSYSVFSGRESRFLMADVPGHEEYTRNMAFAASGADAAIIMIAANKGIVPQTRRHTRICSFMGITSMIFAVNKMDMVDYGEEAFLQAEQEICRMMQEYPDCSYSVIPVAAKCGDNVAARSERLAWYQGKVLLDAIETVDRQRKPQPESFCMPVQRICKSSQMPGAVVKNRVIQGEILSGTLCCGDEIYIYPTGKRARVTGLYRPLQPEHEAAAGTPAGVELDRELDVARGYILTEEDNLTVSDRIEADILWTSDRRLTPGRRCRIKLGTKTQTAVVTRISYRVDVNTGEHKYAEYLMKNGLARCELCLSEETALTCAGENRALGTFRLFDRESGSLAAYGNVVRTVSDEAWKEAGRPVTAGEREEALGQRAGLILFDSRDKRTPEWMNFMEHYLLRMGFHTVQARDEEALRLLLSAGLIVFVAVSGGILPEQKRIFDCRKEMEQSEDVGQVLKKLKSWASELI